MLYFQFSLTLKHPTKCENIEFNCFMFRCILPVSVKLSNQMYQSSVTWMVTTDLLNKLQYIQIIQSVFLTQVMY